MNYNFLKLISFSTLGLLGVGCANNVNKDFMHQEQGERIPFSKIYADYKPSKELVSSAKIFEKENLKSLEEISKLVEEINNLKTAKKEIKTSQKQTAEEKNKNIEQKAEIEKKINMKIEELEKLTNELKVTSGGKEYLELEKAFNRLLKIEDKQTNAHSGKFEEESDSETKEEKPKSKN